MVKVLLIGVGCLALLGILATAGMYYVASRLKSRALQRISEYTGVPVGDVAKTARVIKDPCALLPKEEVEQVLGIQIEKTGEITETGEPGCAFFASPEAFQKLAQDSLAEARTEAQAGAKVNPSGRASDNPLSLLNNDSIKNLEGIVKTFGIAGQAKEGDGRVFAFTLESNVGRDSWQAGRVVAGVVPGFEPISGVGDKAMIGPFGHVLYVLQGSTKVTLNLMTVPDARTKGVALARKIVSRL